MAEMSDKAKYEFRRSLEEVQNLSGRGTELISLYIPPGRQISDIAAYLRNEYSQSSNIKSKGTKKNVMAAIDSILSRLKYFRQPPENGLVFFVGHVAKTGDQTEMVAHVIEPPEPVPTFYYRCDSSFYLEPLEAMLEEKRSYGLVVIDRKEATIGMLKGKRIHVIKNKQSQVPSKHGRGGQSARRFERLIELAAHEYYVKIGELINEAFLGEKDMVGILVGGPGATKDYFISKDYIHHELKKKVVDTFDTGYTDEYGLKELVEKAKETLSDMDLMREKALIQRLLEEIKKPDGGNAAYGESYVRNALRMGAVDTLLISDALRQVRFKAKCGSCGHELEDTMQKVPDNLTCPKCEEDMEIVEKEDIVEELYKAAEATGSKVELISGDSDEGEMLMRAFGGLAAILRFKVNMA